MKRPRSLKSRALQLLALREQSRVELRRKLLAHARAVEADPSAPAAAAGDCAPDAQAQVDAVLDWLEANRFLSAERFVESRVRVRAERFGNVRIRHELAQHEVVLSSDAEQGLVDSELARARAVRARKFPQPPATPAESARQARFLGARGFSSDVIRRVLREAAQADAAGG
ncbi:MAG TPA: RecX family transcriptional regulator [Caldimonas sp.]